LLLPLLLLYEICFHRAEWCAWYSTRTSPTTRLMLWAGAGTIAILMISACWYLLGGRIYWFDTLPSRDFSGYERVLTQGRVQFFYLSLLFWPAPSRLNIDHDFLVSKALFDPVSTALALAGLLLIVLFAIRNLSSRPQLAFPLLAYLLLHSMESAPLNLELVFEHRMYQPMTMLALLLALNLGPLTKRYVRSSYAVLLTAGLFLATAAYQRNQVWGDPIAFIRDTAHKSPNKFRPQYNLGTTLGQRGMLQESRVALEQAVRLKPTHSEAHNQLGNIYLLGKEQLAAERQYNLAIEHNPKNAEALYNLSALLLQQQRYSEQREVLERFIEHAPPYLDHQKKWAISYLKHDVDR
jgi:tetratricopeptide (TPR) repeat protein